MRSKILMCLFAFLMVTAAGAFASPADTTAAPATTIDPPSVQEFLDALGSGDPSEPINQVVVSCSGCTSNWHCDTLCGAAFCGGICRFNSYCRRSVCDCLYCP